MIHNIHDDGRRHLAVATLPGTQRVVLVGEAGTLLVGTTEGDFRRLPHGIEHMRGLPFEPAVLQGVSSNLVLAADISRAALLHIGEDQISVVRTWPTISESVYANQLSLDASADGRLMMLAARDHLIRLQADGSERHVRVASDDLWRVAVADDGGLIATGRASGHLELRDPRTLEVARTLQPTQAPYLALAFSRDGRQLAFSDDRWQAFVLDFGARDPTPLPALGKVIGLHYLSNGHLVVVNLSRSVRIFSGTTLVRGWQLGDELGDSYIQGSAMMGDFLGVVLACEQAGVLALSFE